MKIKEIIEKRWQEEDPIVKRIIYLLIVFVPFGMIFAKQINKIIEFISIKFRVPMNSTQIWPLNALTIFLILLLITFGMISYLVDVIKRKYRK